MLFRSANELQKAMGRGSGANKPESGRFAAAAERVAKSLEERKAKIEPGMGMNDIPQMLGQTWNLSIMVAQAMIRGGAKVADAIDGAFRYALKASKEPFPEDAFRAAMKQTLENGPVIVPGQGMRVRRFAERVAASPGVTPEVRSGVAESKRATYKQIGRAHV